MMFQTQIIKLDTLKDSLSTIINNLSSKCKPAKDYEVTVIVKEPQPSSTASIQFPKAQLKRSQNVDFNQKPIVLNEGVSESCLSLDERIKSRPIIKSHQSVKSNTARLPSSKIRFKLKEEKQNENPQRKAKTSIYTQTEDIQQNNMQLSPPHTEFKIEDSALTSQRYSYKINNLEVQSDHSQDDSEEGDGSDGGFLIQKYLNGALEFIEKKNMGQLQDFLYKFKEKHSFMSVRAQTKWSLLMGYCKQTKMEYERAATNYSQVITALAQNPMMLILQVADIESRLGRCYFQMGEWNKAILTYSQALNRYKKAKKSTQYANCICNLGVLYMEIGYLIEAERCFLMAFNIKRAEGDRKARAGLLPTYCHLFDCNLRLKNMLQCEQLLGNIGSIIEECENVDPLQKARYYTRCGKLLFFQGRVDLAENHYHLALNLLKKHQLGGQDMAEVLELICVLKQETGELQRAKWFLERGYRCLQKCLPADSPKLQVLKKKISALNEAITRNRQLMKKDFKTAMAMLQKDLVGEVQKEDGDKLIRSQHQVFRWKKDN